MIAWLETAVELVLVGAAGQLHRGHLDLAEIITGNPNCPCTACPAARAVVRARSQRLHREWCLATTLERASSGGTEGP